MLKPVSLGSVSSGPHCARWVRLRHKSNLVGVKKRWCFVSLITERNNPDVSSEIPGFGTTNMTGKRPDFSLSLSGYV